MVKYPTSTNFTVDYRISIFEKGVSHDLLKQLSKYKHAICHRQGGDNLNPEYVNRLVNKHTHCYMLSNLQSIRYTSGAPSISKRLPVAFVFVEIKQDERKARLLIACCLERARGVGRRLIAFTLNRLKEMEVHVAVVEAVMNEKVVALYENMGFSNMTAQKSTYTESSEDETSTWLEMRLDTYEPVDVTFPLA